MTTGERVIQLRKQLGYNQTVLGQSAGVSKAAVSQWERDLTEPDRDALLSLQRTENVNPEWLINNNGEMFNREPTHEVNEERALYSKEDRELISKFHELSKPDRARLSVIIDALNTKPIKKTGN